MASLPSRRSLAVLAVLLMVPAFTLAPAEADRERQVATTEAPAASGWCLARIGDTAYFFGGSTTYPTISMTRTIVTYDLRTRASETLANALPAPLGVCSAAYDGSHFIYVFGGRGNTNGQAYNTILRFDPATKSVTTLPSVLPQPRYGTVAFLAAGKIFVLGGWTGAAHPNTIVAFDPANDGANPVPAGTWSVPTDGALSTFKDGAGYVVGGCRVTCDRPSDLSSTVAKVTFTSSAATVASIGTLPVPVAYGGTTFIDGDLYVFGGLGDHKVLRFRPSDGTSAYRESLSFQAQSVAGLDRLAYEFGGPYVIEYNPYAPSAPLDLQATAGPAPGQVQLSWSPPSQVEPGHPILRYTVQRGDVAGGPYAAIGTSESTAFTDTGASGALQPRPYYYRVTATSDAGEGPESNEAAANVLGIPTGTDGFTPALYRSESAAGTTPFGGAVLKPPFGPAQGPTVNLAMGELVARFPILHATEPYGGDFDLTLTYRSMGNTAGAPGLAARWDANWLQRLQANGTGYDHFTGDGRVLRYTPSGGGYAGPPGSYTTLASAGGRLELTDRDGNVRVFDPAQGLRLTEARDPAGNAWTVRYDSPTLTTLTSPTGRTATLTYATIAGSARLTEVAFAGLSSRISYDGATGRPTAVETPGPTAGTSLVTSFTHDAAGRLTAVRDPALADYLKVGYDGFGRVLGQVQPDGTSFFFTYLYSDGVTTAWDANTNQVEWRFRSAGAAAPGVVPVAKVEHTRGLRATDPAAGYTTSFTSNSQDEIASVAYPAGNRATFTYDEGAASPRSRGNLLSVTRTPGTVPPVPEQSTTQSAITESWTYQPACNLPATATDARGLVTRIDYDVDEATLGDKNGDAVTTQHACRPVRIEPPTTTTPGTSFPPVAHTETFTYDAQGLLVAHTDASGRVEARDHYATAAPGQPKGFLKSVTQDATGSHAAWTTTFEYTDQGHLRRGVDTNGHDRLWTVDLRGRVTREEGPMLAAGRDTADYLYDANDNLVEARRETATGAHDCPTGACSILRRGYDRLGRLTSETTFPVLTQPLTVRSTLDGNGNLRQRTAASGETQQWTYDERNLLLSQSGPDGGTFAYDANGNLATATDPLGRVTTYRSDGFDRPALVTPPHPLTGATGAGPKVATTYDAAGHVVQEKGLASDGRLLYARTAAYDELGQLYQRQDWLQDAATTTAASPTAGPNQGWVASVLQHDALGRVVQALDPNGHATTATYDGRGAVLSKTDAMGNAVAFEYDAVGNLAKTTSAIAGATSPDCPQTCIVTYAYDAADRPTAVTRIEALPGGATAARTATTAYDGLGNVARTVDEKGNAVEQGYDLAGRPTWTRRATSGTPAYVTTSTAWDADDRLQQQCDAADLCTVYGYLPGTSIRQSETPPVGPSVQLRFDAAGHALRAVSKVGATTTRTVSYGYDALGRLCTVDAGDVTPAQPCVTTAPAGTGQGTTHQQFTRDDLGRVTLATDNGLGNLGSDVTTSATEVRATKGYDTLGRVLTESQLLPALAVSNTYDNAGNVLATRYPDGRSVARTYDAAERLATVSDGKGPIAKYTYLGGLVQQKEFGGVGSTALARTLVTPDSLQRPATLVHKGGLGGATTLATLTTRYDPVGNRAAQKLQGPGAAGTDAYSQLYDQNGLDQLQAWRQGPIDSTLTTIAATPQTWTVDGQQQWTARSNATASCTRTYAFDGATLVRSMTETCTGPSATTRTYTWDPNGRLVGDGTYTYVWDALDRLTRVNEPSGKLTVAYAYDALGRRIVKAFPDASGALGGGQPNGESWYTFSSQDVVQESQRTGGVLPKGLAAPKPGIHVIRQWAYGTGIDDPLVMDWDFDGSLTSATDPADKRYFYLQDSAGNALGLVYANGTRGELAEGYVYQAYGDPMVLKPAPGQADVHWDGTDTPSYGKYGTSTTDKPYSPAGNLWFFTGRQYDPETGLYNYRAREYHPTLGQFMTMDPIGTWGDGNNLGNAYAYVGNNPGTMRDPSGHCATSALWNLYVGGCLIDQAVALRNQVADCFKDGWACPGNVAQAVSDQAVKQWDCQWDRLCSSLEFRQRLDDAEETIDRCSSQQFLAAADCFAKDAAGPVTDLGMLLLAPEAAATKAPATAASWANRLASKISKFMADNRATARLTGRVEAIAESGAEAGVDLGAKLGRESSVERAIRVSPARMQHIVDRHFPGGSQSAGKSIFRSGENVESLANGALSKPYYSAGNGLRIRAYDVGRIVGRDAATGLDTHWVTIVTRPGDSIEELWTAHPGWPRG